MRGGVADALDAVDFGYERQQLGEIGRACADAVAPGVHVLAEQRYLLHTLTHQHRNLGHDIGKGARHFLAARVRHHAEAAVLAAAFHDRDVGARALDARRGQVVELLDQRKADVDLRLARGAALLEKLRQTVQRLRAEDHVDERRALADRAAFLARDAAADRDHQPGFGALQVPHAPQIGEQLLLRLLAHRAGVEHDEVRIFRTLRALHTVSGAQHVGDLVRVVLVHLAAEGAQVELPHQGCFAASCVESTHTSRTWPAVSRRYFTTEPGGSALGMITRFDSSRICAPGASCARLPSSSTTPPSTWRILARCASLGIGRICAAAALANNTAISQPALIWATRSREIVANQGLEPRTHGL